MSKLTKLAVMVLLISAALPLAAYPCKAPSILTDSIFSGGETDGTIVSPFGTVELAISGRCWKDDFTTTGGIAESENLTVDNPSGEVTLAKATRYYGGAETDKARACVPTSDGNYVFCGSTGSSGAGGSDFWLVKLDVNGNVLWQRTYGGGNNEFGRDVKQTADGGYILTGYTYSYGAGSHDVWLVKTDANGIKQWSETFGGDGFEYGEGVDQCADGGYIIVGCDYHGGDDPWSEVYLIRTDATGNELWNRTLGQWGHFNWGYDVKQVSDGNFVFVGYAEGIGSGKKDVWLVKLDDNGVTQWQRTFGGSSYERGYSFQETNGQGLIITGYTSSFGDGDKDVWLIKTNRNGHEEWNRRFGGDKDEEGAMVIQTDDGGYIVTGETWSFGSGTNDIYIVRTDENGNRLWNRTYGGTRSDFADAIAAWDDGFIIFGTTWSYGEGEYDVMFMRTDEQGYSLYRRGHLHSLDLAEENARAFEIFSYTCLIPGNTELSVGFSQDGGTWYNSTGVRGGTDIMIQGFGEIDLTGLGWNGSGLYYRIGFFSESPESPVLLDVELAYEEYLGSGTYTSEPIDNDDYHLSWRWLSWVSDDPPGTSVKIQIRSALNRDEIASEPFVGPDGNTTTFYTSSGKDIWEGHDRQRWFQYRLYLGTIDRSATPSVDSISFIYNSLPRAEVDTPMSSMAGYVRLNYTLADGDGDPVNVIVQYRVGFGMYRITSPAPGSESIYDLLTSGDGVNHVFLWDSEADLGPVESDDVFIRITPSDSENGIPGETTRFTVDNQPPSFTLLSPLDYANTRNVTLLVETDENARVRWDTKNVSYGKMPNQFTGGEGIMRHTTVIMADPGLNTIYVSAMDSRGNGMEGGRKISFFLDTDAPEEMVVLIDNGMEYTNKTSINITLMGTRAQGGAVDMMFANDASFTDGVWEPFVPYKRWELEPGDGKKTIYVALRDRAENVAIIEGSIILDTTPPVITVLTPGDETNSTRVTIVARTDEPATLRWDFGDDDYYSMTGTFETDAEGLVHNLTINASLGKNRVFITARDMRGNAMRTAQRLDFTVNPKEEENGGGSGGGQGEDGSTSKRSDLGWWILAIIFINLLVLFFVIVYKVQSKAKAREWTPEPVTMPKSLMMPKPAMLQKLMEMPRQVRMPKPVVRKDDIIRSFHTPTTPGDGGKTTTEYSRFQAFQSYRQAPLEEPVPQSYGPIEPAPGQVVRWKEEPEEVPEPPGKAETPGPSREPPPGPAPVPEPKQARQPKKPETVTALAPAATGAPLERSTVKTMADLTPAQLEFLRRMEEDRRKKEKGGGDGPRQAPPARIPIPMLPQGVGGVGPKAADSKRMDRKRTDGKKGEKKRPVRDVDLEMDLVKRKRLEEILGELKADVRTATDPEAPMGRTGKKAGKGKSERRSMDDLSGGFDALLTMIDRGGASEKVELGRIPVKQIQVRGRD